MEDLTGMEDPADRVLKISDPIGARSTIDFLGEVRKRVPVTLKRIQTYRNSGFDSPFTWHLEDSGIEHQPIPVECPEANGTVGRGHRADDDEFSARFTSRSVSERRKSSERAGNRAQRRSTSSRPEGKNAR